jgi:D-glycero-D-manno-heptose 1,7-bisphosphate phosphatase
MQINQSSPKAVLLDRDGVINHEIGDYIKHISHFKLLPHAVKHIALLHQMGVLVFVVTNQGGIAKGMYTVADLDEMHAFMNQEVEAAGGLITEAFYCPHHPDFGNCLCRKPGSLMAQKILAKYKINPEDALFIGDKARDVECANGAGVQGVLIHENEDWGPYIQSFLQQ